jgi:hypothetical protein
VQPAVSGLEKEYDGQVKGHNVDATTDESKQAVRELGFQLHGIVIRSPAGEALWKQADHAVKMEDVRQALTELLGN